MIVYLLYMKLSDQVSKHFRLVATQSAALEKLSIFTIRDLLLYIPSRYEEVGKASNIKQLLSSVNNNELVTVYAAIENIEKKLAWKSKRYLIEATISDYTDRIKIKWFNQSYIVDSLKYAKYLKVTGKLTGVGVNAYFANPLVEVMPGLPELDLYQGDKVPPYPIYKSTNGITSRWFYYAIRKILNTIDLIQVIDPIPEYILHKYSLPTLNTAILWAHIPRSNNDSLSASKRFAFSEVFYLQLSAAQARARRLGSDTYKIKSTQKSLNGTLSNFIKSYPFTLTSAQQNAITNIISDMQSGKPMARLLEGDVGSGKTAVAAAVAFAVSINKLQVSYMAPTEVLATQLFNGFINYFNKTNIQIGLLTGSGCKKYPSKSNPDESTKISKTQLLKWVAEGSIDILIGTHALIQKNVKFKHLALAIIDEQHRFGTKQRALMLDNNLDSKIPHLLSMTATPIPRTLALTIYGDLDLSIIDEMPSGRKKIITKIVGANDMNQVYEHIKTQVKNGRQAYVICPRIAATDMSLKGVLSMQKLMMSKLKSVEEEYEKLINIFPDLNIGKLHGKLKPNEKDDIMQQFANKEIDILIATSVIEVGVNVPNATVILIEGAERFGLSQLHQLRGRVIRSNHQSYCYLATSNKTVSSATKERLQSIVKAKNGFELAEMDLELRGAGELRGENQWGIGDIGMNALKNIKMVEAARKEAQFLINKDSNLSSYVELKKEVTRQGLIHLE